MCNTYLQCLSCWASFSCKSTKLIFRQQPVQQLIQTLHQKQYLWYLKCVINVRKSFIHDLIIKNLPLYSCYGQETFGIQSELNFSSYHNFVFHNSLHMWKLRGCNAQLSTRSEKDGDTDSSHARLKKITG